MEPRRLRVVAKVRGVLLENERKREKMEGLEVRKVKINVLERILRRIEDFSRFFGRNERSKRMFLIILWRSSSFERREIVSDDNM